MKGESFGTEREFKKIDKKRAIGQPWNFWNQDATIGFERKNGRRIS